MRCWVLALLWSSTALAADLEEIRATRQKLVAVRDSAKMPGDEMPLDEIAAAKRQLLAPMLVRPWVAGIRHWAESRLLSSGPNVDAGQLTTIARRELDDASALVFHDDQNRLGDLGYVGLANVLHQGLSP
jgi:hypothetical protein